VIRPRASIVRRASISASGRGLWRIEYHGECVGCARQPLLSLSRWLLAKRWAHEDDVLELRRGDRVYASARIGCAAAMHVAVSDAREPASISLPPRASSPPAASPVRSGGAA
jgi:hypothetical protein